MDWERGNERQKTIWEGILASRGGMSRGKVPQESVLHGEKQKGVSPHLETNRSWTLQTGASLSYFLKIAAFPKESTPLKIPDSNKVSIARVLLPFASKLGV